MMMNLPHPFLLNLENHPGFREGAIAGLLLLSTPLATLAQDALAAPALPGAATVTETQRLQPGKTSRYVLGAGDVLEIKVFGFEEYTRTEVILPDGSITLPLIGKVIAGDKTAEELTQLLTQRLNQFLVDPVISISTSKLRPVRVNVAGEVYRPGPVQLQSLSPLNASNSTNQVLFPTVSEAISLAGGITNDADIRRVVLKRYSPDQASKPITLNLWEALRSENTPGDLVLLDGDSLYIPKADATISQQDRRILARAAFAPKTVRVRVAGEVRNPGEIQVRPDSTLSSVVAIAGPTEKSQLKRVVFVRMQDTGKIERRVLNLRDLADHEQVQDGDILFVPKSTTRDVIDIAGQILSPLGSLLNLFR
jgi:polysaccharide biosynthesis/export protein